MRNFLILLSFSFLLSVNNSNGQACSELYIESAEQVPNSYVCTDFVMQSSELIAGFQWTVQWDTAILEYYDLTR